MKTTLIIFFILIGLLAPVEVRAQLTERRVERLETRLENLERRVRSYAGAVFVSGIVAALWAQNTRRNAWLWFFTGAIFAPITLLVLLYKNSRDVRSHK